MEVSTVTMSDLYPDDVDRFDIIRKNTSSSARSRLGGLPCLFGLHNWGPPVPVNSARLMGQRREDGTWDTETQSSTGKVAQECRSCPKYRHRDDLLPDRDRLIAIQRGEQPKPASASESKSEVEN